MADAQRVAPSVTLLDFREIYATHYANARNRDLGHESAHEVALYAVYLYGRRRTPEPVPDSDGGPPR